jgi:hypothetical protein
MKTEDWCHRSGGHFALGERRWKLKRHGNKAARGLDRRVIEQTGTDHTSGVLPLGTLAVVLSAIARDS